MTPAVLSLLVLAISVASMILALQGRLSSNAQFQAVSKKLVGIENRIEAIRHGSDNAATEEDLAALGARVSAMEKELGVIAAKLPGIEGRQQQHTQDLEVLDTAVFPSNERQPIKDLQKRVRALESWRAGRQN